MSFSNLSLNSFAPTGGASYAPLRRFGLCLLTLGALVLAGCSALGGGNDAPPQKEAARLNIAIRADADLNTDLKGRGAPMLLRVYELKSEVAFQEAAFFALQDTDKAALGADLLAVDQFIIRPGETRQIVRKTHPETTAIGVFAGYRDLPNATWRLVHKLAPGAEVSWYRMVMPAHKVQLKIDLHAKTVQVTDEAGGKRPVQFAEESMKGLETGDEAGANSGANSGTGAGSNPGSNAGASPPSKPAAQPGMFDGAKQGLEDATQKASEMMKSMPKLPGKTQ